jgi:hypothetical protein
MRRLLAIVLVAAVLTVVSGSLARAESVYGWTISASSSDPNVNTGSASGTTTTLYLWLQCGTGQGVASAELDLCATGMTVLAFNPMNGWLNAGDATHLLLAVSGPMSGEGALLPCPNGPGVAGGIVVLDESGEICPCPSAANGWNVTVECATLDIIPND